MRIGIDCRLWNETGVGRYIRNLVWELQKIDKKNEYILFVQKGLTIENLRCKNERWKIVEVNIRWHSFAEQIRFPHILYKENLDLMHFPYFSVPIFYNRPFVVTIHDLIIHYFPTGRASTLPLPLYYAKRWGYHTVLAHTVKHAKKIIVPLTAVKENMLQTLHVPEEKIVVTEEGIDERVKGKAESGKLKNNSHYFLYVGNAYPHKNVERLIEAFILFRKEVKDEVKLILVGKNDYFYKRLEDSRMRENDEAIIFRHDVSDEELFSLYKNARSFISPSLMEGFGLPAIEAMSASCPVLLSDIPAFREVCQDVGFYFNPYDITDMKKKMHIVYNLDQQIKQKHIAQGLKRVKNFSWKKMAEETITIYKEVSLP